MIRRLTALMLAVLMAVCLCACKNNKNPPEQTLGTSDSMVQEVVSSVTDTSEEPATDAPDVSEDAKTSDSQEEEPEESVSLGEDEEEIFDDYGYRAFEIVSLLNSEKVHAKFSEAVSYDGEYISATENEIYVDGGNRVFVVDNTKIIMSDGVAHAIDFDEMAYYTYEYDPREYERVFGYALEEYVPISHTEEDGKITEVYVIEQYGSTITSTWVFETDGTFTVSEVNEQAGSFYVYTFEVVTVDVSGMDMTIPEDFEEFEE